MKTINFARTLGAKDKTERKKRIRTTLKLAALGTGLAAASILAYKLKNKSFKKYIGKLGDNAKQNIDNIPRPKLDTTQPSPAIQQLNKNVSDAQAKLNDQMIDLAKQQKIDGNKARIKTRREQLEKSGAMRLINDLKATAKTHRKNVYSMKTATSKKQYKKSSGAARTTGKWIKERRQQIKETIAPLSTKARRESGEYSSYLTSADFSRYK